VFGEKDIDKGSYKEEFKVSINMLYILEGLTQRKPPGIKRYILLFCCSLILDRLSVFRFIRTATGINIVTSRVHFTLIYKW